MHLPLKNEEPSRKKIDILRDLIQVHAALLAQVVESCEFKKWQERQTLNTRKSNT